MRTIQMLHIIVVAYERPIHLRILIDSFYTQTSQDWQMYIVHDGPASKAIWDMLKLYGITKKRTYSNDGKIEFCWSCIRYHTKEKPTYGHPNRRYMLQHIKTPPKDFVLITNDDNYYVPKFIEYFMEMAKPNIGFIYCDTVTRVAYEDQITLDYKMLFTQIKRSRIDMGSFIVRMDVARETGFNSDAFDADGIYAEECHDACTKKGLMSVYIAKPLFVHN